MNAPESPSLAELAAGQGTPVPCAGNQPRDLTDPRSVWFVEQGAVDLFLVERQGGAEQSAPQHLGRSAAGQLLLGVAPQEMDTTLGVVARGLPGTVLRRLPATSLDQVRPAVLAKHIDAWIGGISAILSRDIVDRPRPDVLVEPGEAPVAADGTLSARRGVVWVSEPPGGTGLFLSLIDPAESKPAASAAAALPLTPRHLAHPHGRGAAFRPLIRIARRGGSSAARARTLPCGGVLPSAAQPPPRDRRPGECRAGTGHQSPPR